MRAQLVVAVIMEALDVQRENDPPDRFLIRFTLLDRAQAVFLSALSTSWVTANLLVRSMPTIRYSLPSAVCTWAMSI